jgi:hypothetical protein
MKKNLVYLVPLIMAFLVFATGLLMCIIPSLELFYVGIALVVTGTLIVFTTVIAKMITSRKRFRMNIKFLAKLLVTILSVFMFMFGLGLLFVGGAIIIGIIIAAIGLLTLLFVVPMFVAFVRANPFEHIIITPNYDDVETDFFIDKE